MRKVLLIGLFAAGCTGYQSFYSDAQSPPSSVQDLAGAANDLTPSRAPIDFGMGAPRHKGVFATSAQYTGNLSKFGGGDRICQNHAAAIGGLWKAWLSQSGQDAIDRIADVGPWYLLDGKTKVFDSKVSLASHPAMHVDIDIDETGTTLPHGPGAPLSSVFVWTGTLTGGTTAGENCQDWTSSNPLDLGHYGELDSTIDNWWTDASFQSCSKPTRLYCLEQ